MNLLKELPKILRREKKPTPPPKEKRIDLTREDDDIKITLHPSGDPRVQLKDLAEGLEGYKVGDKITIRRTSGEVEDDWTLISAEDGKVKVVKTDAEGRTLKKKISIDEFRDLQRSPEDDLQEQTIKLRDKFTKAKEQDLSQEALVDVKGNAYWQQVRYGEDLGEHDADLYRGYLMAEPQDFPQALDALAKIAHDRLQTGKTTMFKWLLSSEIREMIARATSEEAMLQDIGGYDNLKPEHPRIVLYAKDPKEILEILQGLAKDQRWDQIEQSRNEANGGSAPRRPGTNAFIDTSGKEWRSLNYNDAKGYSERQADDPSWRDKKAGSATGPV
ncbi:hypothetical protein A3G67_00365 [Candidatus Roizmanbacteria bacterium RIFCSPLOWO2_12_FULL_40_12]|uniref:Uncharacterized protein n=1 Tax=Candidatus Roizmanbacteria bacterium RIFCSPLOWO2_01_FULL_40_42 TaxID=1802066 RepID=A0A1F7J6F1_9BACT|nr:MAG: hypothetical protein A2779_02585 [Candidatus Roizmanbacteria bacterium RIFCSPHIGHO2_01_FULL_40_98]OGK29106.1 MAG: hypothetical protein A3C31_03370 [Candidatus Roizmanbacteria bacterium RIFCSPHIGHO2_02_FULL_40_53]OGK29306.1 MAG: hypothetical protein A2W49_05010 [Candidatus Roizmanbacteria bacterium RIFCSPHIGHO2_12_41_18]OGK36005.1 MAG: hypothetical protein A3E69_03100 [Candidatus Roizmanbacteria bacterium RIFCSPHIGHO2_12_FULL_40_130]OGK51202.1 MAG: hypothetical protein A3B50_03210 [Candi